MATSCYCPLLYRAAGLHARVPLADEAGCALGIIKACETYFLLPQSSRMVGERARVHVTSKKIKNDWRMPQRAAKGCVVARAGRSKRKHSVEEVGRTSETRARREETLGGTGPSRELPLLSTAGRSAGVIASSPHTYHDPGGIFIAMLQRRRRKLGRLRNLPM